MTLISRLVNELINAKDVVSGAIASLFIMDTIHPVLVDEKPQVAKDQMVTQVTNTNALQNLTVATAVTATPAKPTPAPAAKAANPRFHANSRSEDTFNELYLRARCDDGFYGR